MTNKDINIVAQNTQSTVVTEFTPSVRKAEHYQSGLIGNGTIENFDEKLLKNENLYN